MSEQTPVIASVVIPTRNRADTLRGCLKAMDEQVGAPRFEVVVVDDGSARPLSPADVPSLHSVRLILGAGTGPAAARNAGIAASVSDVILFTDDDTRPDPGWVQAAVEHLATHSGCVGVEGPVATPPYDTLYEYSIEAHGPGHFWTCNVAYRREALERVGGFDVQAFPYVREDRDLAFRILRIGSIGYEPSMRVTHIPRPITIRSYFDRSVAMRADVDLEERHPEQFPFKNRVPAHVRPVVGVVRSGSRYVRREWRVLIRSPRRSGRTLAAIILSLAGAALSVRGRDARVGSRWSR